MKFNEVVELDKKYYMNTFGRRTPVCFTHGKGIKLWDADGKTYYDFLGGLAVNALGHSHPALVNAIKEQAEKLIHCSNLYYIETQAKLAQLLVQNSCADKVFFGNSGAEANEGAIKLARMYFYKQGDPQKYEVITLKNSFHGRTLATLAATGQEKYHKPFNPLTPSFVNIPLNDFGALEAAINEKTCAVMLEPIQGESGVNTLDKEYIARVRDLCDTKGLLLIFDEIQTGLGRTGKLFAYQHFDVEPDIFTLAKALAGGFPIGAVCSKEFVAKSFEPGDHGSTFGGNPLACAAGLAAFSTILNENLPENAEKMGDYFFSKLDVLKSEQYLIKEVRGKGLMIGIELSSDFAVKVKDICLEKGYLVGSVGSRVIRLLPPLIITKEDIDGMVDTLEQALKAIES